MSGIVKKLFKIFVQVWNFSPLQSTPSLGIVTASIAVFLEGKKSFTHARARCSLRSVISIFQKIARHNGRHLEKNARKNDTKHAAQCQFAD